jgi:hypothetical protein
MENRKYRLKKDKVLGKGKVASKGDVVTVISMCEGNKGMICIVNRDKDDNKFAVLMSELTPII